MRRPVRDLTQPGWAIFIAVGVLLSIGLASIYVTDTHYAAGHDGPRNAARQAVYIAMAAALAGAVIYIGYQNVARFSYALFALAVLLLLPLFVAKVLHTTMGGVTPPRNGAYRWIQLPGFQFQPSELFKPAFVLALAWYLRYRRNYRRFAGLLLPFLIAGVPLGLILVEPDLGTVLLMMPVLMAMLFVAGARMLHLGAIIALAIAAVPLAWGQIQGYQRARVTAVLLQSEGLREAVLAQPEKYSFLATRRQAMEWAASSGYQLVQSKTAIGSGGASGNGWGEGPFVTHPLLPDRHNDFIFAIVGHQWGLLGCLLVMACYAVIIVAGMLIASATTEPVGRLLAAGVTTLIACQAIVNMAMATGLAPTTGMTLPFVSHGGSSLLSLAVCLGLLVSVSQHRPFMLAANPFEFSRRGAEAGHPAEKHVTVPEEVEGAKARS
jgi:rod shape determining protein RodA